MLVREFREKEMRERVRIRVRGVNFNLPFFFVHLSCWQELLWASLGRWIDGMGVSVRDGDSREGNGESEANTTSLLEKSG